MHAALGVTGWATLGSSVTMHGALGVTGWATFGSTVTMHAALGVTGTAAVGATLTVTGSAILGATLTVGGPATIDGALGVTGAATFDSDITSGRNNLSLGTALAASGVSLTAGWGATAVLTSPSNSNDQRGLLEILCQGSGIAANPIVQIVYQDGAYTVGPRVVLTRADSASPTEANWIVSSLSGTSFHAQFVGTPVSASQYRFFYIVLG